MFDKGVVFSKGMVPDEFGWVVSMPPDKNNNQTVTYQGLARRLKVSDEQLAERLTMYTLKYRGGMTAVPFFQYENEADDYIQYLSDIYLATYMAEVGNNV